MIPMNAALLCRRMFAGLADVMPCGDIRGLADARSIADCA